MVSKFLDLDGFPVGFTFCSFPLLEQDLDGRFLTVNIAAPKGSRPERAPREAGHRIYVGNLPWSVDSGRLEGIFSEHGSVVSARVVSDRETGRSRGFGFVEMSTESEMNDAISSLDGEVNPFALFSINIVLCLQIGNNVFVGADFGWETDQSECCLRKTNPRPILIAKQLVIVVLLHVLFCDGILSSLYSPNRFQLPILSDVTLDLNINNRVLHL